MKQYIFLFLAVNLFVGCQPKSERLNLSFDIDESLKYCLTKVENTLSKIPGDSIFPRSVAANDSAWKYIKVNDWTSGFWPGILWYIYEYTGESKWAKEADKYSMFLLPLSENSAKDHDLGFQIYCSFGNGYRLTKKPLYKSVILRTADSLARLYNPSVGTLMSWPFRTAEWGPHNTIIDNMMNLEMLLWACKNGGSDHLCQISNKHAQVTMKNQFRENNTSYHIVAYDSVGKRTKAGTFQGYSDESTWARGQAWAIYGYTMMYRETGNADYLEFAKKVTKVYLDRLPEDAVPYWDFDDPNIPNVARDASSAAIVSSALLDLSLLVEAKDDKKYYQDWAVKMLNSLTSDSYRSNLKNDAFLLHSTGSKTSEIDVSINYADYYYLESLIKLKKILN